MRIKVLAVGGKMPRWVDEGVSEYSKRLPRELSLDFIDIPLGKRATKNPDIARAMAQEGESMLKHVDRDDHVVALEVLGKPWTTEQLAGQLSGWQMEQPSVAILIGGPDGLHQSCQQRARQKWSLSPLTLPHPLVRILLAEQIYRAWSVNQNHPYHRA